MHYNSISGIQHADSWNLWTCYGDRWTVRAINEVLSPLQTGSTQSDHTMAIDSKTTLSWCNRIALLPSLSVKLSKETSTGFGNSEVYYDMIQLQHKQNYNGKNEYCVMICGLPPKTHHIGVECNGDKLIMI